MTLVFPQWHQKLVSIIMNLYHWYLIFTLNSMCSNTWHHFLCGIKIEHQERGNVTGILVSWQLYIHQSLIRCAIESMIWALRTQTIIHPFSSLRTPSDHITSPESNAEPRSPISQFKGPRPLGATTLAETNNLQIGCMCVLKPPQMICLHIQCAVEWFAKQKRAERSSC